MSGAEPIVVTGAAGFIGHAVARRLLDRGEPVVGVDDFNDYYEVTLKEARAADLAGRPGFELVRMDIADPGALAALLERSQPKRVVHLAAQAGVRYDNAQAYARSNLVGHLAVLEACRGVPDFEHLVYASSSSVYGERSGETPFVETDRLGPPTSLYAATKQADELMSEAYARLYRLPQTGLRFFTVYGPWGRPDMAYFVFTRAMLAGEAIPLFAGGELSRDFTYIDDIADGVLGVLDRPPEDPRRRLFNIGAGHPEQVLRLVQILQQLLGVRAVTRPTPKPAADVPATFADVSALTELTGYAPKVRLEEGLARFVDWYRAYYG
ncbi:MAG TPA: NAD-dependent epimerase/dehydratase family protein [Caulobacteraceae bacterium]|nr:NAD-dependent epimerase/dehydratase family protein [Caulobacteraceae bacterium]